MLKYEAGGKKASYPQIVAGSSMIRIRYLILLSLVLAVSGCFAGRSYLSLPGTDAIEEPVAILPVTPAHIIMPADSEEDYLEMAEETNSILNTLAGRRNSKLLGPKKVLKILGKSNVETLHRILDDPGDHARVWKAERLAEMSKRLEVEKIIRVKVEIMMIFPSYTDIWGVGVGAIAGRGKHWRGSVDVSADLFGMSPPRLIEYIRGQKEFYGKIGMGCLVQCIPFPYTVGTTKIYALDRAVREAISLVLEEPTEDNVDTDPVGE